MDEKNCASAVKNPRVVPNDCGCAAVRSPSADRPGEAVPGGSSQVSFLPGGWGGLRCRVSAGYFRFFRKGRLRRAAALFRKGIRRHGRSFCAAACGGPAEGVALPGDSLRRMRTPLRKRRALLLTGMEVRTEAPSGCRHPSGRLPPLRAALSPIGVVRVCTNDAFRSVGTPCGRFRTPSAGTGRPVRCGASRPVRRLVRGVRRRVSLRRNSAKKSVLKIG